MRSMVHATVQTIPPMPKVQPDMTIMRTTRQQNLPHPTPDTYPAIRGVKPPRKNMSTRRVQAWLVVSLSLRSWRVFSCSSLQLWVQPLQPHLLVVGIFYSNLLLL